MDDGDSIMRDLSVPPSSSTAVTTEEEEKKSSDEVVAPSMTSESKSESSMQVWYAVWQKEKWPVYWSEDSTTVEDIKEQLEAQTDVSKDKMQILGLKFSKAGAKAAKARVSHSTSAAVTSQVITDDTLISHLQCVKKKKKQFIMVGTVESDTFIDEELEAADSLHVLDDEEWNNADDYGIDPSVVAKRHRANLAKLERVISETSISMMNEPRKGKKLLVLDIDYTLFDMGKKGEQQDWSQLKRPFTDYLLEKCYVDYDIIFWSQTSWRWIEIKLTEMRMLMRSEYKFTCVLDKECMFKITSLQASKKKKKRKHFVKPLALIWRKFADFYHEYNTIHIDDLARNFALNPSCGLKCTAYRNSDTAKYTDNELLYMTEYLTLIAKRPDFRGLNHRKWMDYVARNSSASLPPPSFKPS